MIRHWFFREKKIKKKRRKKIHPNEHRAETTDYRKTHLVWNKKFTKNIITLEKSYSRDFKTTPRPENRPSDGMETHAVEEI